MKVIKFKLVYLLNKIDDVVLVKLNCHLLKMNCCPSKGSFEFSCLYYLVWRLNSPTLFSLRTFNCHGKPSIGFYLLHIISVSGLLMFFAFSPGTIKTL